MTSRPASPASADAPPDLVLDLRGLVCPEPVLRAKRALRNLPAGSVVLLECTDPLAAIDVPLFARQTGHLLASAERRGELHLFRLVKAAAKSGR